MELTPQASYLKEHVLKCPICYESFSNVYKPLIIPCGHTICSLCIENLKKISADDYDEEYPSEIYDEEFDLSLDSENEEIEHVESSEEESSDRGTGEDSERSEGDSESDNENEIVVENLNPPELVFENLNDNNNRERVDGENDLTREGVKKEEVIFSTNKKIKIKCSICRKKMKIFESEILLNLNILKITDYIYTKENFVDKKQKEISEKEKIDLQVNKEKVELENKRVFCRLCRFIDNPDSHLLREGSENHQKYFIFLHEKILVKLKNLIKILNSNSSENQEEIKIEKTVINLPTDTILKNLENDILQEKDEENPEKKSLILFEKLFLNGVNDLLISSLNLFFQNLINSEELEKIGKSYIKNYFMINSKAGSLKFKSFQKLTKLYENFQQITEEFDKQEDSQMNKKILQKANNCIEAGEILLEKYTKALEQYFKNYERLGISNNLIDKESENLNKFPDDSYSKLLDRVIQTKIQKLLDNEIFSSHWNNLLESERRYAVSTDIGGSDTITLHDLRVDTELEIYYERIFKEIKEGRNLIDEDLTKLYTETLEIDEDGRYLFLIGKKQMPSKSFRVYDLLLRQLEDRKKLPIKFYSADKYFFKNRLFILGGNTGNTSFTNNCYYYEVEADWWEQLPSLNIARGSKSITVHDNKFYVFGGNSEIEREQILTFEMLDLNKMGQDETHFKWQAFKIKNYNEPIYSMLYGFVAKNYLVILGGENDSYEESMKGYLIHMSDIEEERKVEEIFKIKYGLSCITNPCSTLRGLITGFCFSNGSLLKFNMKSNLDRIKCTIYN